MSLSNTHKTVIVDPRSHNNSRTEFKLDDAFYSSAVKLIDVGIYDTLRPTDAGIYYPTINGVMQCIRNIYLYSGTTLIDSLRDVPQFSSIEALKTTNQGSEDLNRDLLLSGLGLRSQTGDGALTLQPEWAAYQNTIDGNEAKNLQVPIATAADGQQSGSVMLSDYLQFLKSATILPMIPDLRLVIEWDTTGTDYFLDPDNAGGMSVITPQVIRPSLVLEEILGQDPNSARAYTMPYLSTVTERFSVAATSTPDNVSVPKSSSFKSQAFTQKFLKDITFFNYFPNNNLAAEDRWLTSKTRSPAQKQERLQLMVNNLAHLPDRGVDSEALKYHFFNETHTQLNLPLAAGLQVIRDASGRILDEEADALQGQFSVTAVKVGKIVDELRIEHERLYGDASWSRDAFTLLAYGTVAKQLEVKDRQVRVSY